MLTIYRMLFAVVGFLCITVLGSVPTAQAMPPYEFTPEKPRQYTPARPPGAGTSSGNTRLCKTVCRKQLTCSGQPADRSSMAPCVGACEQALSVNSPAASKPWKAAAACDRKPCGRSYDACVAKKMRERSPNERKCRALCDKRLRCSGQQGDSVHRQDCEQQCQQGWGSSGTVDHRFLSATYSCLRSSCGLDTEICVARKLGGPNTRCANVCEQRLKCSAKLTREHFVRCMPECFRAIMDRGTKASIEAEARCKGCGTSLDQCIARKLGGYHPYCHKNCMKRSQCRGPQSPSGPKGLANCRQECVNAVSSRKGTHFQLVQAVDVCQRKRCGSAFNQCIEGRQRPQVVETATRPSPPPPPPPPTPQSRCRRLCDWEKACAPAGGGPACLRRCERDRTAVAEFRAIENCQRFDCGRAWDKCMVQKLGAPRVDVRCLDSCRKRVTCERGRRGSFARALATCVRTCRSEPAYMTAITKCQSMRCGRSFSSCIASATARPEPPPPPPRPKPPVVDPRVELCRQLCVKAKLCGDGPADELCQNRCMTDASARREFTARKRCGSKPCRSYGKCVYQALGVPQARLKCVAACKKDAECKRVKGQSASMPGIVRCAKRCRYSSKQLVAIEACSGAGCGMAYKLCIDHKLNPKVVEKPVVEEPKISRKEQTCRELCEKAESCVPTSGGEACVQRCVRNRAPAEFRARNTCRRKRCDQYETCIVRGLGMTGMPIGCIRACRHHLNCRPPGEGRNLKALMACARSCPFTRKQITAVEACAPVGCGQQYTKCYLEKSGQMGALKQLKVTCDALCKKADQCTSGHGDATCVRACMDKKGASREFLARKQCGSKSCTLYPMCILKRMGVSDGVKHRCYGVCSFEMGCDRSKRPGDLDGLATCLKRCSLNDEELSIREDCQVEGCGSMYKTCVRNSDSED